MAAQVTARSMHPFFDATLKLKKVRRAGWVAKVGVTNAESVAYHTFSMCAISMLISDTVGADTEKTMRMVILHDLAESITGDIMPGDANSNYKIKKEVKAMKKILSKLPANLRSKYHAIWEEYLQGVTTEARLVHRIDKLEMALQAESYLKDGYEPVKLEQFFESAEATITTENDFVTLVFRSLRMKRRQ